MSLHAIIPAAGIAYLDTGTLGWVNVNHPHDVARAEALLARVAATHPSPHPHS